MKLKLLLKNDLNGNNARLHPDIYFRIMGEEDL